MSELIVVWVSCGAASAVAAIETKRRYADTHRIAYVNSPIKEEDPDNLRFMADLSRYLDAPITQAVNSKYPNASAREVWTTRKAMAFPHGAPCTLSLKKDARREWQDKHKPDWHVLGFTLDERARHERFVLTELPNVLPVLIDAGITKPECFIRLAEIGIRHSSVYDRGYPNANCIGCVKATSPTYWNHVRRADPAVFDDRAEQSRGLGVRLVRHKGSRIFLDELPSDAKGRAMKTTPDCGIFCEEKP